MVQAIPQPVKDLWDKWNIRGVLVCSLTLQTILIFSAPSRKRMNNKPFLLLIWSAYLLADWVANFAIGLISDSQGDEPKPHEPQMNNELLAFWAPFLLLHLGGPDTITALALASLDRFKDSMLGKPDAGPNYSKLMEELETKREMKMPTEVIMIEEPSRVLWLILSSAFKKGTRARNSLTHWIGLMFRFIALGTLVASFIIFKAKKKDKYDQFDVDLTYALLIGGMALDSISFIMFCVSDWTFAILRKPKEEWDDKDTWVDKVLNWVLGFRKLRSNRSHCGHEVLSRKFIFRRWSEYINAYNLIGFCLRKSPKGFHQNKGCIHTLFDKIIQRLLINQAIEKAFTFIHFCFMRIKKETHKIHKMINRLLDYISKKNPVIRYILYPVKLSIDVMFAIPHLLGSLISHFLDFFGIKDQVDEITFVSGNRLTKDMWEFIFKEVKNKSHFADDPESSKRISSARGEWTLREPLNKKAESETEHETLLRYVTDVDYDQSILLWHIATEIFYQKTEATERNSHCEFSKILSDYMMYLLIMQPTLMSSVMGIGKIRFRDTCEEAKRFFNRRHLEKRSTTIEEATEAIQSVNTDVEPMDVKGDRSKSVLFDASILAKKLIWLQDKREEDMWEVVSKVWVELLSYAATHCDAKQHAAHLRKGAEFISFVWLLMAHFGLGDQFQITKGDARAKLIVGK